MACGIFKVTCHRLERSARAYALGAALLRQPSESLAGRLEVIEAGGFRFEETGSNGAAHVGRAAFGVAGTQAKCPG